MNTVANKKRYAINFVACLLFVLAISRAIAFWAADPMLAYANNYDQIRSMRVFGLQPRDSGRELYASTPEQPWRYFKKSDSWHGISYPSSDLLFKAAQYSTMRIFKQSDGSMDIKVGALPILLGLLFGAGYIFWKMLEKPLAATGFALWLLLVFDPINLLFLNTWYAEFSAFAMTVLLVGTVWLWLVDLISTRSVMRWGAAWLFMIASNRNQYMFIMLAVLPLAILTVLKTERFAWSFRRPVKLVFVIMMAMLPVLVFSGRFGQLESANSANRVDTVFGALLPATDDPAGMMKDLDLSYDNCAPFIGKNWYIVSHADMEQHCPQIMKLSLLQIGIAVARHPMTVYTVTKTIAMDHKGFMADYLGQIEGLEFSKLTGQSRLTYRSANELLVKFPGGLIKIIIWICALGPGIAGAVAWLMGRFGWGMMLVFNFIMFNYALISSVFGDGYIEIERHAILCFSFGALFLVLLLIGCCAGVYRINHIFQERMKN